jgi:RNA polymerase sigma factor (sigma-70 family)
MPDGRLATTVRRLHTLIRAEQASELTDGQLLERFALRRDEDAFALLVRRHGPMVLGVCRRLLGHEQDAEDAFQATFLVLARRAPSVRLHAALGSWLYRVAVRVVHSARRRAELPGAPELAAARGADADPAREAAWRELRPVLDEEVRRLPEKYRAPVVLCYLRGKTHEAAAAELGWPRGTVAGRLARARDLLRRRLTRRGVTMAAGALATALSAGAAAAVPEGLARGTAAAACRFAAGPAEATVSLHAAELARGVLHAMFLTRLKLAGVVLLLLALIAGVGASALGGAGGKPAGAKQKPELIGKPGQLPAAQKQPAPVTKNGLAIAVLPLKQVFAAGEAPAVEVTLKNVADKALTLHHDPSWAYPSRRFVLEEVKTGRARTCGLFFPNDPVLSDKKLSPGESLTTKQDLTHLFEVPPANEPLREPLRLGPGKYRLRATLRLHANPRGAGVYWSGELTSGWAEFEVAPPPEEQDAPPAKQLPRTDHEAIQGTWRVVDAELEGRVASDGLLASQTRWVISDKEIALQDRTGDRGKWSYQLDPGKSPKAIDLKIAGGPGTGTVLPALYHLAGDRLKVCICGTDHVRPEALATRPGKPGLVMYTLKREPQSRAEKAAGKEDQPGKAQEYLSVSLMTPSGWHLRIHTDGSGNFGYGSSGGDFAPLTAGSYDFSRVVEELKKRTQPKGNIRDSYTVWLHRRGTTSTVAVYTTDVEYVAGLFATARARSARALGGRMAGLWSQYPPTPRSAGAWRVRSTSLHLPGPPFAVALAPDGKLAATGARPRLWDTATGKEVAVLIPLKRLPLGGPRPIPPPGFPPPPEHVPVRAVAFSPDGTLLATGGQDGTVKFWEVEKRAERATPKPAAGPAAQTAGAVLALAFHPDGRVLAVAAGKTVRLWDVATGKELAVCSGHALAVGSVAFSPDGKTLATASADRSVRLWDAATGKELHRFERHSDWVNAVAFSPGGKRLASVGKDRTVQLWDLERRELVCTLRGHTGEVRAAVFTPDGKYLLTGGDDRTARVWDVTREGPLDVLGHTASVRSLALSRDGGLLAVAGADNVVKLWEAHRPGQAKE